MSGSCFYIIINTKKKNLRENIFSKFFRNCPHSLRSLILHTHTFTPPTQTQRRKMNMKQSPCNTSFTLNSSCLQVQVSTLCSTSKEIYYGVFQISLHMKIKLSLRNMNERLYGCYQKSTYQLCPHMHSCHHVQELHTTQTNRLLHSQVLKQASLSDTHFVLYVFW